MVTLFCDTSIWLAQSLFPSNIANYMFRRGFYIKEKTFSTLMLSLALSAYIYIKEGKL